jgi:glycosyltransferase involved in cell wall biosynthesis
MNESIENKKQITILFLGTQMAVGGAQKVLFLQADWFQSQGYNVVTAYFYDKENLKDAWNDKYDYPVIDLGSWQDGSNPIENGFRLLIGLYRLWKLYRQENIQIVETFTPDSNLLGLIVARLAGVPVCIASYHGLIEGRSSRWMRLHAWLVNSSFVDKIVAVSERVRRIAVDEDGIKSEKVEVILNGIEPLQLSQPAQIIREKIRAELKIPDPGFLVLSVGRVTVQKGHTYLLDAVPSVLEEFPDTVFLIAGDGHLRESLVEMALQLDLGSSVYFLGTRNDIPDLLSATDLFVMPSLWEGMPIALLEAMEMGLPVVVSNLDEISAFVKDEQQGLLVEPKNVAALSEAIIRMLTSKSLRMELAVAGQAMVRQQYTVDQMCRQYEKLFQRENDNEFAW